MKLFGTAIILAGGKSTRMGFDKQRIRIDNNLMTNHIINKLFNIFDHIIVVTNTPKFYEKMSCITVQDEIPGLGPLSGIHVGLKYANSSYSYVIACDMPNINLEYIEYMMDRLRKEKTQACVTLYKDEWIEPFNGFYCNDLVNNIEAYLKQGRKSIYNLLKDVNCTYIEEKIAREYSPSWEMFYNLNTKEDLEEFIINRSISSRIGDNKMK